MTIRQAGVMDWQCATCGAQGVAVRLRSDTRDAQYRAALSHQSMSRRCRKPDLTLVWRPKRVLMSHDPR
jgi:hypothetical protein